jgi:uncharacterized membrane protein
MINICRSTSPTAQDESVGDAGYPNTLLNGAVVTPLWLYGLLGAAIIGYVAFFSWLSIMRHQTFQSGALDLGYTDQVVWNMRHGRFFCFSTLENAPIDLPLDQFRRTDSLLAYHVEPLLIPISLIYLIWEDPQALLVLQSVAIGLGAVPLFRLARDHLGSTTAGMAFTLAWLLAPAVEGANLTDFHTVAIAAPLILFAFRALQTGHKGRFIALCLVVMTAREDMGLLVMMIGLYVFLITGWRRMGTTLFVGGLSWFLLCTQVIIPSYSGLSSSPFLSRLAIWGPTVKVSLQALAQEPLLLWEWITRPEILIYLAGLLASAGFLSLLAPELLVLAAPILIINVFSAWPWTYSEGVHYSISIMPFIMISGITGMGTVGKWLTTKTRLSRQWLIPVLAGIMLLIAGYHHYEIGISPWSASFTPPRLTTHDQIVQQIISRIPPDAPLTAQSNLYPHLSRRRKAYLFPAINDAEYVVLDVTSTAFPLTTREMYGRTQALLRSTDFGLLTAQDGCLLFQRRVGGRNLPLPDGFYTFARVPEASPRYPLSVRFGDLVTLVGYNYERLNVVSNQQLPATVTTYWQAAQPLNLDYSLQLLFTQEDGAVTGGFDGWAPTTLWYPPSVWNKGETIRVETPILPVGRGRGVLVALTWPGADPLRPEARLGPIEIVRGSGLEVIGEDDLLKLFVFPK